jgi:hypothetical protein
MNNSTFQIFTENDAILNQFYRNFYKKGSYFVAIPGIVLNLITALIFFGRKTFWENGNKMGIMYMTQALTSILPLLSVTIVSHMDSKVYKNMTENVSLTIFKNIQHYTMLVSLLIQLLITIERWYKFNYNLRHAIIFKLVNIIMIIIFIYIICLIPIVLGLFFDKNEPTPYIYKNRIIFIHRFVFSPLFYSLNVIFYRIIPLTIIFILNILLTKKLYLFRNSPDHVESRRIEYKFGITLIAFNSIYIFSAIPFGIFTIYAYLNNYSFKYEIYMRLSIWFHLINEALPFFIQILFNKHFRIEFIKTVILLVKLYLK